jgi:hypothetical protein
MTQLMEYHNARYQQQHFKAVKDIITNKKIKAETYYRFCPDIDCLFLFYKFGWINNDIIQRSRLFF